MWQFDSKSATWTDPDRGLSIVRDTRSLAEIEKDVGRAKRKGMDAAFVSAKQLGLPTYWGKWKQSVLFKLPNGDIQTLQVLQYCAPTSSMRLRPLIMRIHLNNYPVRVSIDTATSLGIDCGYRGEFRGRPHRMELSCLPEETGALSKWMCRWLVDLSDPCPYETEQELFWHQNGVPSRNEYVWTRAGMEKIGTFQTWQSDSRNRARQPETGTK